MSTILSTVQGTSPPPTAPACSPPVQVGAIALTPLINAGVRSVLEPFSDLVTFGAAGHHDVGLVDPDLVPDGWHDQSGRPVVALARDRAQRTVNRAEALGADVVVVPGMDPQDLVASVRRAHRAWRETMAREAADLSAREAQVVSLICRGRSNAEIGAEIYLSVNSIKTYIRSAYRKMGVDSRSQAVLWGLRHGL